MSVNITFDGQPYIIPETGEVGWGGNTTSYLVAIAAGALQKTGGSFTLSAETDFGADFGIQSLYYKSRTANVAAAGILRLANNSDNITWRNAANDADLSLLVNASDQLTYETNPILTGTGPSAYVASATGTSNQVIVSGSTGAVTFSLPQSINTGAAVRFGTLGLGGAVVASSILSLTSTTLGFIPPRMTTVERDAIGSPATGLFIYNTSTNTSDYFNGSVWVALAAGGTINAGTQFQLGYYAAGGTTISGLTLITASRALVSDADGLPVASTVSTAELQALAGLTASRATQTDGSGLVSVSATTATELGALAGLTASRALETNGSGLVSPSAVTATELGFLSGAASNIQTQIDDKAADNLVVHLAGIETITGQKTFNDLRGTFGANIAAGSNKITGLDAGSAAGESIRFEQLKVLQVIQATSTTTFSTTSTSYQSTNLSVVITPFSTSSRILIMATGSLNLGTAGAGFSGLAIIARGTTNLMVANGQAEINNEGGAMISPASLLILDAPSTTSATTYRVRIKNLSGSNTLSWSNGSKTQTIIAIEINNI